MKYLTLVTLGLFIILGYSTNKNRKIKKPRINNSIEKFDFSGFPNEIRTSKTNKNEPIYINKTDNIFNIRDKDGKTIAYFSKGYQEGSAFSGYDYSENPIIGIYKEFYPNNNIKVKGIYCWFGFKIGKWYNYSDNGGLISTEDFDSGFIYNMDQVFSYCQENGISLEKKESGYKTTISKYKSISDNKNYWGIRYPNYEKQVYINIQIDGTNGNIVKTVESPFPAD